MTVDPLAGVEVTHAAPPLGAALEAELGALRPIPTRRPLRELAVIAAASIGWAAAMIGLFRLRPDLGELPRTWLYVYLAAWLLGFLVPLTVLVVPRRGRMLPRWPLAAAIATVAAVGFVVGGLAFPRSRIRLRIPTSR